MNVGWEFSGTNICSISGSVRVSGRRYAYSNSRVFHASPSTTTIMLRLVAISRVRYWALIWSVEKHSSDDKFKQRLVFIKGTAAVFELFPAQPQAFSSVTHPSWCCGRRAPQGHGPDSETRVNLKWPCPGFHLIKGKSSQRVLVVNTGVGWRVVFRPPRWGGAGATGRRYIDETDTPTAAYMDRQTSV